MAGIAAATRSKPAVPGAAHVGLSRRARVVATAAVLGVLFSAIAPEAQAACSAPVPLGPVVAVTCPYTGAEQTYTIPAGADRLRIVATGGSGQEARGFGRGAAAAATIAVGPGTPVAAGSVLYVEVGGDGDPVTVAGAGQGGFNGGANGGSSGFVGGGGGGGATDVRTCSIEVCGVTGDPATDPRLIVAGGGGGTGAGQYAGGAAGAPSPGATGTPYASSVGGGGAGSNAGGTGGDGPGGPGLDGIAGIGGAGGTTGGGGGGGGFFGGGGGGGNNDGKGAGGGGGSSYVVPAATDVAFARGAGDRAQVTIIAYSTMRLSPASAALTFGEHEVDAGPSPVQTSTLRNSGNVPVTLTAVMLAGTDAAQFEQLTGLDGDCGATTTLTPGAACDLRARFDPSSTGAKSATLTVTSNAPAFSVALSGTGTARVPVPPPPPPRAVGSELPLPLTCTGRSIVLVDVRRTAAGVEVSGLARTYYRGRSASIRPLIAGKGGRAVSATVQPDGSFRATLPLPAARNRSTVRYQATVAGYRSAALKLVRQLVILGRSSTAAGTRITAQVAGGGRQTITVTRQLGCTARQRIATVHTDRSGRFSVTLPFPSAAAAIAYYRATTTRPRGRTFTLPIVVRAALRPAASTPGRSGA
jgi:hypothetical protein